jgi:hypothetical protein
MTKRNVILLLFSASLLGGCQAKGDSTSANDGKRDSTSSSDGKGDSTSASNGKRSGGILSVLRPDPITVPEGTSFALLLETAMSSATSQSGDRVVAKLAEDVRVGEKVVVPAGSEVRGRVTTAVPSGRTKTRARLAFDFDTLVLDRKEHSIDASAIDITAQDTHKKDAATIGIGAGAGAIIGAIANGGKGAAVGTLIGGAAGTGVVLVNTGKEVRLDSGTRVTVRLTRETRL